MTELNQSKHDTARQFHTDLKDFHRIDTSALKPKTLLKTFWQLETADLFEHFKANRKTLATAKVNLDTAAENKIRERFESAKSVITPLEKQIAGTDLLIDQIVYRLYGLTEEEIRIVEDKS